MIRRSIRSLCGILLLSGCTYIPSSLESILPTIVYNPKPKITYEQASQDNVLDYDERSELNLLNKIDIEEKGRYLQAVEGLSLWIKVSMKDIDRSLSWRFLSNSQGNFYEPFFSRDVVGEQVTMLSGSKLTNDGERVLIKYELSLDN